MLDEKIYDGPNSEALFFKHLTRAFEEAKQSIQAMSGAEVEAQLKVLNISVDDHVLTPSEVLNALSDTSEVRLFIAKEFAAIKAERPGENAVPIFLKKAQEKVLNRGLARALNWSYAIGVIIYPIAVIIVHQLMLATPVLALSFWVMAPIVAVLACLGFWAKYQYHKADDHPISIAELLNGADKNRDMRVFIVTGISLLESLDQISIQCKGFSAAERVRKKEMLLGHIADLDSQASALLEVEGRRGPDWREAFTPSYTVYKEKADSLKESITRGECGKKSSIEAK